MRVVVEARAAFAVADPALLDAGQAALPVVDRAQGAAAGALGAVVHADEHDERDGGHGDGDAGRAVRGRRPDRRRGEQEGDDARVRQGGRAALGGGDVVLAEVAAPTVLGRGIARRSLTS